MFISCKLETVKLYIIRKYYCDILLFQKTIPKQFPKFLQRCHLVARMAIVLRVKMILIGMEVYLSITPVKKTKMVRQKVQETSKLQETSILQENSILNFHHTMHLQKYRSTSIVSNWQSLDHVKNSFKRYIYHIHPHIHADVHMQKTCKLL